MENNNAITFFAKTNFRNQERVFGIKTDDRRRHMYIIGKTGMGKTNLLENMVIQDIRNGHGVCYIDPHGDTAEKLLKAIPSNRINDVIYFNPADQSFPIAFNVMESVDPEYRHLVASGLVGVFKKIWADSWGPRLEYILRNTIMALLEYPGSTLLGVTRMLVDKKYRERVVDKVTDPVIRQFWTEEFPKWSDKVLQEVVSPIQNKVGQFLSNSLIRNIVGQTQSSFDVRQIMDGQKILIMNLSKGRIGEDASALMGAMMITKIQLAAMGRVDIPEETRNDFYLYVDEFQNFSTESFANILSEARKYRLNLILANQYVEQIMETVRNAIFGNVGTIISFRVGAMDAEFLEKEFAPVFVQNDIVNLPKYNIYLKLMIDGIAGDAFSATTLPPVYIDDTKDNEDKVIAASRERYTTQRAEVEDKIARWSGMMPASGFQTVNRPPVAPQSPNLGYQQPSGVSGNYDPIQPKPQPGPNFGVQSDPESSKPVQRMAAPAFSLSSASISSQAPAEQPQPQIQTQPQPQPQMQAAPQPQQAAAPQQLSDEELDYYVKPVDERPKFDAICDMCGDKIQVPFMPDGKRPTFCKDCLKDYQRMTAKDKLMQERKTQREQENVPQQPVPQQPAPRPNAQAAPQRQGNFSKRFDRKPQAAYQKPEKRVEHKLYAPQERPMTLSQLSNVAPKKFKPQRPKPKINLDEVRNLINNNKKSDQ
ncbi:MAG TPA: CxxC-x17-CxxC domain-containing protein [Patescibacteria group bacterium]